MTVGKVYLVGAGPGDPKLITVYGMECIQEADVILYDRLANEQLLNYAKKDAELIFAGNYRASTESSKIVSTNCLLKKHFKEK